MANQKTVGAMIEAVLGHMAPNQTVVLASSPNVEVFYDVEQNAAGDDEPMWVIVRDGSAEFEFEGKKVYRGPAFRVERAFDFDTARQVAESFLAE